MLVALHDVRSEYYTLKGGHVALVISGDAQNVGTRPLHLVEIDADLIGDGAHPIASQSVDCGNELSAKMLGEMTPREIEFSQGLSPQKGVRDGAIGVGSVPDGVHKSSRGRRQD